MRITTLLLIFFTHTLSAQVNLIIEDQTEEGFFLGINDFLQNPEEATKLVIKDLDTIPYLINIDSDTFKLQKTIHLRENETHRFVLVKNFYGQVKLRYRGTESGVPSGYETLAFSKTVPWPEERTPSKKPTEEEPVFTASTTPPDPELKKFEDDTALVIVEEPAASPQGADVLLPGQDTIGAKTRTVEVEEPEFETPPFDQLISGLETTEFEFEKLLKTQKYAEAHTITLDQMKEIFTLLKYDNSRLQLFETARRKMTDVEDLEELKMLLEYEVSKKQFEKMTNEQ